MARNKYPEVTVEKILTAALKLFSEKGYDNTTIQDIVNELGGLTKGAIYHHFKSKEDIMNSLCDKMFEDSNPFELIKQRTDLNGLQKMQEVIRLNFKDDARNEMSIQALPILKNPRILAESIRSNLEVISPLWLDLINMGIADGSIHTAFAKELSELLPLVADIWASPSVYPATEEEVYRKIDFMKFMLDQLGLPLLDEELSALLKNHISKIYFPKK